METHLAVAGLALGVGWILNFRDHKPVPLPTVPPCHCHCGCDCPVPTDHTLLFIIFLAGWSILTILWSFAGLLAILLLRLQLGPRKNV